MQKPELRQCMRQRLAQMEAERYGEASAAIVQHIIDSDFWKQSAGVLLYSPLPMEPQITPLFFQARTDGKRIFYPKVAGVQLELYELTDPGQLKLGSFGVMEPDETQCRRVESTAVDMTLVPGLAFDMQGVRLGRGQGYYDRFLAEFHGAAVGCFFSIQEVEEVPLEPHDQILRSMVTEKGLYFLQEIA